MWSLTEAAEKWIIGLTCHDNWHAYQVLGIPVHVTDETLIAACIISNSKSSTMNLSATICMAISRIFSSSQQKFLCCLLFYGCTFDQTFFEHMTSYIIETQHFPLCNVRCHYVNFSKKFSEVCFCFINGHDGIKVKQS